MNTARIVVLAIAVCAGGAAAYLASGSDPKPVAAPTPTDTTDFLVARIDIPLGQTVTPDDIAWQGWPSATASASFIRRNDQPEAMTKIVGSIARSPFLAGEPIRETKLVKGNGSGFMAAILPSGMRAISTEISPETGAGGFILPNDKVDVILTKRERVASRSGTNDVINSEIILSNIRVLAIDQTVGEKDGQKVVVGKTTTLELKPDQAETLARARQAGTLSLALRSLVDANRNDINIDDGTKSDSVNVVRYGVTTTMTTRK
ncbi:MAG: Flp pilus assembly protein CpaB [Candidatus Afipia apatlaquensis]|uniref:Flp pilus assembly protein CpaB n=1 Tax=Candidatus Afipia apatlaquensis TaxID=2712852 RepID=A0A7C9VNF0_9BRAD|nr:Flp pilus assembly protein CpaB [Candidatus Afipia apatlaquensis]